MAKRVKAGELNESLIIQSFKNTELLDDPADVISGQTGNEVRAEHAESDIPVKEQKDSTEDSPAGDTPKAKSRKRRGNYDEVFLKKKELKTRQPVYISQNIHQRINRLVHMLALADKEISVGGYIDNVLEEHLEQHKEEIAEYRRQIDDNLNP